MEATLFDHFGVAADLGMTPAQTPANVRYREVRLPARDLRDAIFESYRVGRIEVVGAHAHGTPLVESAALAAVVPPLPRYRPLLEPALITKGLLSHEQLEAVIYAGEQHAQTYETLVETTGEEPIATRFRAGFLLGDATGVGKGRILAAIVRDGLHQGRSRAVWFSLNELLVADAVRDWTDLGGDAGEVTAWSKTPINQALRFERGILFCTYAMLRSQRRDPKTKAVVRRRIDQLVDALGADFDGVIIFDECHALANADPKMTDAAAAVHASQQGRCALELQQRLPDARIVYSSATGASRADALAYAQRLRLWGAGCGFANRDAFLHAMERGGTAALEVVCRDLKALGRMCARSLSFEGVEYERITHELDAEQIELWNSYNAVWRMVESGFTEELIRLGAIEPPVGDTLDPMTIAGSPLGRLRSHSQAAKQRFYAQAVMALKMPTIIEYIKTQLAAKRAIVLQLTHTNEAQLDRALDGMAETDSLETLELSHREILIDFVRQFYPTQRYRVAWVDKAQRVEEILDGTGAPVVDPAALRRRDQLIANIEELIFPDTALDLLYDAFGEEAIAEVSGRSRKLVRRRRADGSTERVLVKRTSTENARETDAFLDGAKPILAFTEGAGGIGRSYHADIRFTNQRRRVHIFLEMSWRAEGALQGMGRTHRTGQVSAPIYVFCSTTIPGEKRFSSTPARRIAALGALSRGQREAADNGLFRAEDNLETPYAHAALRKLLEDIAEGKIADISRERFYLQTGIDASNDDLRAGRAPRPERKLARHRYISMTRFLNRLLACDVAADGGLQGRLMTEFVDRLEAVIDEAIAKRSYDVGVETFRPNHLRIRRRESIYEDTDTAARTELLALDVEQLPSTLTTFAAAKAKLAHYERLSGLRDATFALQSGGIRLLVPVRRRATSADPLVRVISADAEETRLAEDVRHCVAIDEAAARPLWDAAVAAVKPRCWILYVIAGALTPIWERLPATLPTVYRMQTDEGERLLARVIMDDELADLLERFELPPRLVAA